MPKFKNKKKWIIVLAVVIVATGILYIQIFNNPKTEEKDLSVEEIEYILEKGTIRKAITGSGSIEPADSRTVVSVIEGTLDMIYLEEGEFVEEEGILALYEDDSDTQEELNIETAKYNLSKEESNLSELYEKRNDFKVYAENSGTVRFFYEEGDEVSPNNMIGEFIETGIIKAESYFTIAQIDNISVGDAVEVFINDSLITIDGEVSSVDRTPISTNSNAIAGMVEVEMNYNGKLASGTEVRITVVKNSNKIVSPYTGQVVENNPQGIYPSYNAKVYDLKVESGSKVEEGDLVAVLESESLNMQIEQQEILVQQNKLTLEDLLEEDSTVTSPIDGTILTVFVDEQGYVERGTQLFQVADLNNMEVVIEVDELDIMDIEKGMQVTIECDVFEDEKFEGEVSSISLKGQNQNGVTSYDVTISIKDRKQMMSGMNVDLEILIEEKENVLIIPLEAIVKVGDKYLVQIKDEEGNLSPQSIEIGIANDNFVEIISGLKESDKIYYTTEASEDFSERIIPGMGIGGGKGKPQDGDKK